MKEVTQNVPANAQTLTLDRIQVGTWIPPGKLAPTQVHLGVRIAEANEVPLLIRFKGCETLDEVILDLHAARHAVFATHQSAVQTQLQIAKQAIQVLRELRLHEPDSVSPHQLKHLDNAEVHLNLAESTSKPTQGRASDNGSD
jgi:hypothetical protein